ncbi:hypothetical protein [Nostoc sp. DedSLP04]|uniref:hypothetical protein n=1 Tax=Nostoc sp. DedSLP04 TaxID=3075401 RepID=UPI002AD3ADF2|nr:hypothetical protein [Nostoc sp. DedSLP04]MDZ8035753.1 hypothetical protein [Nostoc sp. DedSLP04]
MATIKISELQPESQFEKLSDADLRLVNGGNSEFQFVLVGTAATTGINIGPGRITNGTDSFFQLNGGVGSPRITASLSSGAFSNSSPN